MKPGLVRFFFISLLFIGVKTSAQQTFTLSGRVTDSIGNPKIGATIFLGGTKYKTASNDKGEFSFDAVLPGSYRLSATMIGFYPYSESVAVRNSQVTANVVLKTKTMVLREVEIGTPKRPMYINMFRNAFIGSTLNALECKIANPDIINFHFDKKTGILTADADELLIIESKRLGYRIQYLLKDFNFNTNFYGVTYDGETSFEELPGTDKQKKEWAKNRLETYKGSKMHFLRSVYNGETKKQGFEVYNLLNLNPAITLRMNNGPMEVDVDPVEVNKLVTRTDSGVVSLNFNAWYIDYVADKPPVLKKKKSDQLTMKMGKGEFGSILKLVLPQALIDSRGSVSYHTFYVQGFMGEKRVGDQLPFEYQPPEK